MFFISADRSTPHSVRILFVPQEKTGNTSSILQVRKRVVARTFPGCKITFSHRKKPTKKTTFQIPKERDVGMLKQIVGGGVLHLKQIVGGNAPGKRIDKTPKCGIEMKIDENRRITKENLSSPGSKPLFQGQKRSKSASLSFFKRCWLPHTVIVFLKKNLRPERNLHSAYKGHLFSLLGLAPRKKKSMNPIKGGRSIFFN